MKIAQKEFKNSINFLTFFKVFWRVFTKKEIVIFLVVFPNKKIATLISFGTFLNKTIGPGNIRFRVDLINKNYWEKFVPEIMNEKLDNPGLNPGVNEA